jgi:hypothetical protein
MESVNEVAMQTTPDTVTEVKICKEKRYYYRHREKILEKRRQKRLQDPAYQEKVRVREERKQARENEKIARELRRQTRLKTMTELSTALLHTTV